MSKGPTKATKAIQGLLDEKERIEQWLDRLQMAADETPSHVRQRVEEDYRGRLADVMTELHGHRDELEAVYQRFAEERAQLSVEESTASERLAEAELRHSVGEYDEEKWKGLKTEILESLVKIRESLQSVESEIGGLDGVLALLRSPPATASNAVQEAAPAPEPVEAAPQPAEQQGVPMPQTDAFDDTEHLKLETEDSQVPGATEARGEFQTASDGSVPQTGRAQEPEVSEAGVAREVSLDVGAEDAMTAAEGDGSMPTAPAAKTLTCQECGTANLPTEWYCERCGAELDAV